MKNQRGGFATGLIVGLLIGLTLALGVALYITKVPVPFMNKVPQRPPEQDAAEAERNKNWDPNAALAGKAASRPAGNAAGTTTGTVQPAPSPAPVLAPVVISPPPAVIAPPKPAEPAVAARSPASAPATAPARAAKDPAAILSGGATPAVATAPAVVTPQTPPKSTKTGVDPFIYFVQAGAYTRGEDAEQQRANLALLGMAAKVTEREQSGRTVFRVRLGPFEKKEEADAAQEKLQAASVEAALVRVERQ
jgi:cell division protein FtsN